MVREIVKDNLFLSKKSILATKEDLSLIVDLVDTLLYNKERCVGLALNMIGINKQILATLVDDKLLVMINPKIIKKSKSTYLTSEACLSHSGSKEVIRHNELRIEYLDSTFNKKVENFSGFIAQVIAHEMDHFEGILI